MTAQPLSSTIAVNDARSSPGRLAGFGALVRKDIANLRHGPRIWVILVFTTAFMALTTANSWINAWVIATMPPGSTVPDAPISMAPLDNIVTGAATQVVVIAAIFVAMGLLVGERERGTLAWVASKPVSRGGIWVATWAAATTIIWLMGGVLPLMVSSVVAGALYGMAPVVPLVIIAAGMAAAVAFFVAVVLAASTVVSSQSAVAAIGFAVFALPSIVTALVPFDIAPYLPTSIVSWSLGVSMGADVGFVTPVTWAIAVVALVWVSIRKMEAMEL